MIFNGGNLLKTIQAEIESISKKHGLIITYVFIHEDEVPAVVREMIAAGMMPEGGQTEKIIINV